MADHIPDDGSTIKAVDAPIPLAKLQTLVGGFIKFVPLSGGELLVVNEAGPLFAKFNARASEIASRPIFGHAVYCLPSEIE